MTYQAESYEGQILQGVDIRYYGMTPFLVLQNDEKGCREIRVKEETIEEIKE